MANPYTNGEDLDPFAEKIERRPAPQPQPQRMPDPQPQWAAPPQTSAPQQPQFYNPPPQNVPPSQPQPQWAPQQRTYPQQDYTQQNPQQQQAQPTLPPEQMPMASPETQTSKFWTMAFYQQFFDVETKDVLRRMGNTLLPIAPPDFLFSRRWHYNNFTAASAVSQPTANGQVPLDKSPDLYGPFWICTTLWMALAVVGNMMSKISHSHAMANRTPSGGTLAPETTWSYDFTTASVACVTIYCYCGGMSLLLWGLMKWKCVPASLIDTLCIYGYSMFIFFLAAILCVVPVPFTQWVVCVLCGLWSSAYLLLNFWQLWKICLEPWWFIAVVIIVTAAHILVTLSFKFYFLAYDL